MLQCYNVTMFKREQMQHASATLAPRRPGLHIELMHCCCALHSACTRTHACASVMLPLRYAILVSCTSTSSSLVAWPVHKQ